MIEPKIRSRDVAALLNKKGIADTKGKKQQVLLYFNDNGVDWNSFFRDATERSMAIQYGQDLDFTLRLKDGSSLHMHVYTKKGYMLCHIDNYNQDSFLKHLLSDTDAKSGIVLGGVLCLLLASTRWEFIFLTGIATSVAALNTPLSENIYTFGPYNQSKSVLGWKINLVSNLRTYKK